jgi:hypothetical protein
MYDVDFYVQSVCAKTIDSGKSGEWLASMSGGQRSKRSVLSCTAGTEVKQVL